MQHVAKVGTRSMGDEKKHLKIQGYDTYYRPAPYAFYPTSPLFPLRLLPLPPPPSFLCLRFPGCGPGALPWPRFRWQVPGAPARRAFCVRCCWLPKLCCLILRRWRLLACLLS
eukprot:scaffold16445_cov33-Tisochrysis_lutea.AAC.3